MIVIVIMGLIDSRTPAGFAPIAIGLWLTLIHLISIPVTNTSVNPARSTGPGLVEGGIALQQLWLFWLAPLVGAVLGGRHIAIFWPTTRPQRGRKRYGLRRAQIAARASALVLCLGIA